MKTYIITKADLDYFVANCFYPLPAKAIAESLTPIGQLSDVAIAEICRGVPSIYADIPHGEAFGFARAIERHIIGDGTP